MSVVWVRSVSKRLASRLLPFLVNNRVNISFSDNRGSFHKKNNVEKKKLFETNLNV